jgi:uncharacterized protein YdhG (YjbR/CyaY superfamily)
MQSAAADVDAFLEEVPPERRGVLAAIRQLCRNNLPGYEEGMDYGMPSYKKDGEVAFAFNSQKHYIAIYGLKPDALEAHRAEFAGANIGKGCIRYRRPEQVDLAAVARLIRATAASGSRAC